MKTVEELKAEIKELKCRLSEAKDISETIFIAKEISRLESQLRKAEYDEVLTNYVDYPRKTQSELER